MPLVRKGSGASPPPAPPTDDAQLDSPDAAERWRAARALTQPGDVGVLGAALAGEQSLNVREAILASLCRIATPESAAAIEPLLHSDDANIRRGALDALISMPGVAGPLLPGLLADPDSDVRLLSCEIARALPAGEATRLLSALLQSESVANVCIAAIDVLTEIGGAEALSALRNTAARFPAEPFVQFAVENALERITAASVSGG